MSTKIHRNSLKTGYTLHWYVIKEILGQGGFGITYLAYDNNLQKLVAIKEYLPIEMAVREGDYSVHPVTENHNDQYKWGLDRFLSEARTLAQFNHPNIVRVHAVFEENNTGYMVMSYEEGTSLSEKIKGRKTLEETELLKILIPLMGGLELMHDAGFIHRDIKPDNIFIRNDGSPVLLDFGSARQALGGQTHTLTSLVTPGYAPFEQYYAKSDEQGPWSDIYGLGATLYRAVTGVAPMDAVDRSNSLLKRSNDSYVDCIEICSGKFSERFLNAINHALKFNIEERPQTIDEWRSDFDLPSPPLKSNKTEHIPTQPRTVVHEGIKESSGKNLWVAGAFFTAVIAAGVWYWINTGIPVGSLDETGNSLLNNEQPSVNNEIPSVTDEAPVVVEESSNNTIQTDQHESLVDMENTGEAIQLANITDSDTGNSVDSSPTGLPDMEKLQKLAVSGDMDSQVRLGDMYYYGEGITVDYIKAREYYEMAAVQGNQDAQNNLGDIFNYGYGVTKDFSKAKEFYEKASVQGNPNSQINLGYMYDVGQGVKQDYDKARDLYEKSAAQGNPYALYNLALMYENGRGGLEKNDQKAAELYQMAAAQDHTDAQYNLALMYEYGRGGLEKNDQKAAEFYQMAAAKGYSDAQNNLALMYETGRGGLEKNDQKAAELYQMAAAQGNTYAQNNLGLLYEGGRGGLEKNDLKATELYQIAADQGNAHGQNNLGRMYENGFGGLKTDKLKAVELYKLSAAQGNETAIENLERLGIKQ